jgi:hypothetical protein
MGACYRSLSMQRERIWLALANAAVQCSGICRWKHVRLQKFRFELQSSTAPNNEHSTTPSVQIAYYRRNGRRIPISTAKEPQRNAFAGRSEFRDVRVSLWSIGS